MAEIIAVEATPAKRKRGQGVGTVYDILKHEILDLTMQPGSPIDEVKLTERFSMSRTPIREALVKLASEGLVVTLPNRSTVVAPIDFQNLAHFFDALTLMYRVTTRLAATNRTDNELLRIRELQKSYEDAVSEKNVPAMIEVNREGLRDGERLEFLGRRGSVIERRSAEHRANRRGSGQALGEDYFSFLGFENTPRMIFNRKYNGAFPST